MINGWVRHPQNHHFCHRLLGVDTSETRNYDDDLKKDFKRVQSQIRLLEQSRENDGCGTSQKTRFKV